MPNRINFIDTSKAQVCIIRGDYQARVYHPTPSSLVRLANIVRHRVIAETWWCLPFSNGWIAQPITSYHASAQKTLNISGQTDVETV